MIYRCTDCQLLSLISRPQVIDIDISLVCKPWGILTRYIYRFHDYCLKICIFYFFHLQCRSMYNTQYRFEPSNIYTEIVDFINFRGPLLGRFDRFGLCPYLQMDTIRMTLKLQRVRSLNSMAELK